ncbi:hypothetical protein BVRB_8g189580 [Beta vulgaris subsp. vulgaris]|nr:hypothetical protein BVRB_8g189580 [Beta vulgaris subsp. vulgaris]
MSLSQPLFSLISLISHFFLNCHRCSVRPPDSTPPENLRTERQGVLPPPRSKLFAANSPPSFVSLSTSRITEHRFHHLRSSRLHSTAQLAALLVA